MFSAKTNLRAKFRYCSSWTTVILYGWKFKSFWRIHRTVLLDILRVWAGRIADHLGLLLNSTRTASFFACFLVVLGDTTHPSCSFVPKAGLPKLQTHSSLVFRHGSGPRGGTSKCNLNFRRILIMKLLFLKNVLTANARYSLIRRSIVTKLPHLE